MDHLGLDLGTTTISAAVLDADGRLLCTRTVPGGAAVAGQPWERKQDASGIECTALSLLDGLLQEFPDIGCVGLTGQMHGIVYVDAAGQLLSPLYTWQDETGAQPGPDGKSTAARLTARTGYPLASGYGLVTLACHQAAGTIPNGAAAVCTIADYLAMRLSGRTAPCLTPSMAASLGLFDGTDFDREAVRRAGLPERLLPEVSEKAELTGGRLHVFAALGDNQASFLGAGQGRLDAPLVNIGTGSQFSFFTKERRTVPGLETRPFPGGWLLTGAPLCGGRSFALLERFFRQTAELVTGTPCPSAYPAMLRALEAPMPDDVPQFRTTFAGTRQDPAERAVLSGLDEENFAPVPLLHALLRGMADELSACYRAALKAGCAPAGRLLGSGNGLRRNPALQRAVERSFGLPLTLAAVPEEAACGAALFTRMQHEAAL